MLNSIICAIRSDRPETIGVEEVRWKPRSEWGNLGNLVFAAIDVVELGPLYELL
ncbi:hypothetical protein V7S43_011112 [Phytophthora oleae]|uniref:Uncharacterized protein n=1 Tax=Phytophthora oleae TaxID=2107226 RepID=A0ABD3FCP6_9STRA